MPTSPNIQTKLVLTTSPLERILYYLFVVEFFLFSGEVYLTSFIFGGGGKSKLLFFITSVLYAFASKKGFKPCKANTQRVILLSIWVFFCTFIVGQGNHDLAWTDYILIMLSIYIFISSTNQDMFINTLLTFLIWLSAVTIIIQLGHDYLGLFPTEANVKGVSPRSLLIFNTEWGSDERHRMASIFWEPGQYQIVIYYIIAIFADEWSDIDNWKVNLKKYGILLLALVLTFSTMGYVGLLIIAMILILRNLSGNIKFVPLFILLGAAVSYMVFDSSVVQEKIEQSENDTERSSYTIRLADNLACINVMIEDPITGFGPGSDVMNAKLFSEGNETSSNGWLYSAAQLGIPYILSILLFLWSGIKRFVKKSNKVAIFLLLFIVQCNESCIFLPYMYLWVFVLYKKDNFKKYEKFKNLCSNSLLQCSK